MLDIKLVITDCDGSLTDGTVFYDRNGPVGRRYSAFDGKGFERLLKQNIDVMIITQSSEESALDIIKRAERFQIDAHTGVDDKKEFISKLIKENYSDVGWEHIAYFGDDINDLDSMFLCPIVGCPETAHVSVKDYIKYRMARDWRSAFISVRNGGEGAFRDFADFILILERQKIQ